MKAKYVNPFTDFGFKKIFGEEASKPLLMDFLNALLPQEKNIVELSFKNPEQLGQVERDRRAVYDIYCENERGEKFIVELQKAKQNFFRERTIYYSTFPIREQAEKGEWNFNLNAVYCIGILDFRFDDYTDEAERSEVLHTVKLKNQNGKIFYDKLTYLYLEMPNFNKEEKDLVTRLDKWLFFIKHLEDFESIPVIFKDKIFTEAFEKAELAKMNSAEMDKYEYSLKSFRDLKNTMDYAMNEGAEARALEIVKAAKEVAYDEGKSVRTIEIVKSMKGLGVAIDIIAKATGLSKEEIEKL
jgi:predicted transposase/invertase (TIGR01784 family)